MHISKGFVMCPFKFCTGVVREIKKLWPGTVLVSGKPHHSESNGGIERRNRTVEEKYSNWMNENNTTHWARVLSFIQWGCNTQIHRGIGNMTPYHLMFGQHPQVGISCLPMAHELLENLAAAKEVIGCLGLEDDVPLEDARLISSMPTKSKEKPSPEKASTGKSETMGSQPKKPRKSPSEVHYESFKTDLTENFASTLAEKGNNNKEIR